MTKGQVLLTEWKALAKDVQGLETGYSGRLRLGCHPSVAQYTLPLFLRHLMATNPNLDMELMHGLSRDMARGVLIGEIDMAIVINPHPHADLVMKKLGDDEVRLWNRDKDFDKEILIFDPALAQSQWILKRITRRHFFKRRIESGNLEVIARLTQAGVGVGLLPSRVISGFNLQPSPDSPVYRDGLFLIYRSLSKHLKIISQEIQRKLKIGKTVGNLE